MFNVVLIRHLPCIKGINLSSGLEEALALNQAPAHEQWLSENREAIASYNAYIETNGVFSDGIRGF